MVPNSYACNRLGQPATKRHSLGIAEAHQRQAGPRRIEIRPQVSARPSRARNGRIESYRSTQSSSEPAKFDEFLAPGTSYDPDWNKAYWATRPVTVINRLIQIGYVFGKWQIGAKLNRSGSPNADAAYLRTSLSELGPAFVKIGQAVSSRPDIVPPGYLEELEKLQDNIPAFSSLEAFAVLEEELGQPVQEIYSKITPEPVAAASLGQVYRATLKSTGTEVAVKVQRPRLLETLALDLFILRNLAFVARRVGNLNSDLPGLIDEWASSIYRETSYIQELENGVEFKNLFRHYTEVYVPDIYAELTSEKVLTMEWIDGTKPRVGSDGAESAHGSSDDIRLVEVGVRCSLSQILQEGFYHADPHPGNLLRMEDGRLCYLDFGMMGRLDKGTRIALIRATLHLVNQEFDQLADDYVQLGLLPKNNVASQEEIIGALTSVFQEAVAQGVSNLSFGTLSGKLGSTMYKYKFQIPTGYTLLVRSLAILEGIALSSNPDYRVLGAAYPWVARSLLTDTSPELRATLRELLYSEGHKFRFDRLESLLEQALKSPPAYRERIDTSRDALTQDQPAQTAVVTKTAAAEGSAVGGSALELLLSEGGDFILDILLDETAKGIDAFWRMTLDGAQKSVSRTLRTVFGATPRGSTEGGPMEGGTAPRVMSNTVPGAFLFEWVEDLPSVVDEDDAAQVAGLQRLIGIAQKQLSTRDDYSSALSSPAALASAITKLGNWVTAEAGGLSPQAQQRALALPFDLISRLNNRAAARFVKLAVLASDRASQTTTTTTPPAVAGSPGAWSNTTTPAALARENARAGNSSVALKEPIATPQRVLEVGHSDGLPMMERPEVPKPVTSVPDEEEAVVEIVGVSETNALTPDVRSVEVVGMREEDSTPIKAVFVDDEVLVAETGGNGVSVPQNGSNGVAKESESKVLMKT